MSFDIDTQLEGLYCWAELTAFQQVCDTQPDFCFCEGHPDKPQACIMPGSNLDRKVLNVMKHLYNERKAQIFGGE